MKVGCAPITHYSFEDARRELCKINVRLLKYSDGHAEILMDYDCNGKWMTDCAIGWLSKKQVERLESEVKNV
jgi:hypothetical protein